MTGVNLARLPLVRCFAPHPLEAGKDEIERHEFDLRDVLDDVLDTLAFEADRRQLELIGSLDGGLSGRVVGDAGRLRQVLINLASNALKFTDRGEIEIHLEAVPVGPELSLRATVRDTGIGIPHEKQVQIFEAFAQAHAADPRSSGGLGLGLAISQRLVRMMGGELGVESEPGRGSTFSFTARLGRGSVPSTPPAEAALVGARVLIVDVNGARGRMLAETLRGVRGEPLVGADPTRAAEVLAAAARRGQAFTAVLLAVEPAESGAAAIRDIRAHPALRDVPLIVVVSLRGPDALGASGPHLTAKLPKPVKQRQVIAALTAGAIAARGRRGSGLRLAAGGARQFG